MSGKQLTVMVLATIGNVIALKYGVDTILSSQGDADLYENVLSVACRIAMLNALFLCVYPFDREEGSCCSCPKDGCK